MTEEIIIDGVNVAGCEFYLQDEKYSCDLSFINQEELCKCNDVQDCYYKQLKRLEQENKELKEENIKVKKEFNNLIAEIISDIEYTGEIACNGESPKEHLHQMQKALASLKEIRVMLVKLNTNDEDDFTYEFSKIEDKINEVLQQKVDLGFWDKDGEYKEDLQVVDEKEFCKNKTTSNDV